MIPLPYVIVGVAAYLLNKLLQTDREYTISNESDCSDNFLDFNSAIEITPEKVNNLKRAHNIIRKKVSDYLKSHTNLTMPSFFIQGSYKTKTLIENTNEICDIDLGIHFPYKPNYNLETIQNHIKRALDSHTKMGVTVKKKCVRLNYIRDFHVDLPIYFNEGDKVYFGSRGNPWIESDPKGFVHWFNDVTDNKPQLIRVIRYLKAWLENVKSKTGRRLPSGLALTLWAIEFHKESERDDVAFYQTALKILNYLDEYYTRSWQAVLPVSPYDDVLDSLEVNQKKFFYDELKTMISFAADSLDSIEKRKSIKQWRKIFGSKFI